MSLIFILESRYKHYNTYTAPTCGPISQVHHRQRFLALANAELLAFCHFGLVPAPCGKHHHGCCNCHLDTRYVTHKNYVTQNNP